METHSPDSELGKLHSQKTIAASNQRAKPAAASSKQMCWAGRARGQGNGFCGRKKEGWRGKPIPSRIFWQAEFSDGLRLPPCTIPEL